MRPDGPGDRRTGAPERLRVCALLVIAHLALGAGAQGQTRPTPSDSGFEDAPRMPASLTQDQAPAPSSRSAPAGIRYGKWAALGLAAGFTIAGATTHHRADEDYRDLLALCRDRGPCPIGPDGRYANLEAEDLYQRVVRGDRAARVWLVGGQAALIAGVALFVMELKRKGGPENIPFSPFVAHGPLGTRLGVRVGWR